MEYITTKEASTKWGISTTRITILASEGRIPGAKHLGKSWAIPAIATKPIGFKAHHHALPVKDTCDFAFPLYHFRPDWSSERDLQLSTQQQVLLQAESAVLECRFEEAYTLLTGILSAPEDIYAEIGALCQAGLCCVGLGNSEDFTGIFLRLQMLLSEDFPHRDDLMILLDLLKTYVETISTAAGSSVIDTSVHDQGLPVTCMHNGYKNMVKETMAPGSANVTLMELNLRLLQTTGALIVVEAMHLYLLGIYYLRQDMAAAEKHARLAVELAYESKLYFPLITYHRYFAPVLAPILAEYPEEFQEFCRTAVAQYETNFTSFLSSLSNSTVITQFSDADFPYVYAILTNTPNSVIAEKLNISLQTVKRRLAKMCERVGVSSKKELRDYLRNYL